MDSWQIEALTMIGALHTRYVATVDSHPPGDLSALFVEDGLLTSKITGRTVRGRHELSVYLRDVRATRRDDTWANIRHFITPPAVTFADRDHANAQCYFTAWSSTAADHWGIYSDEIAHQEDDEWRFVTRTISLLGAAPGGWVGSGAVRLDG
jgi:SnoaL-like domain